MPYHHDWNGSSLHGEMVDQTSSIAAWEMARAMVERVVERFHPQRVIVFGSLARGESGPDSDIDLLVVLPFHGPRRGVAVQVLSALATFPVPKDVVVLSPEEFEATKDLVGTVAYPAVREGRLLHAA